jgi:serine phosphatase RsbU (regulator of sigma subunit)
LIRFIILCYCLGVFNFSLAQKRSTLDSLLRKTITRDTLGVKLLLKISDAYRKSGIDSAVIYTDKAIAMSREIKSKRMYINSRIEKLYLFRNSIAPKAYLDSLDRAWTDTTFSNEKRARGMLYQEKGVTYRKLGNFEKSISNMLEAIKIYQLINHRKGIYNSYNSLANTYSQAGISKKSVNDLKRAFNYYEKALQVADTNNKAVIAMILSNQGVTYYNIGQISGDTASTLRSIEYYDRSLAERIAEADSIGMSESYSNLASAYHDLCGIYKQYQYLDDATRNYERSIAIDEKLGGRFRYYHYNNYGSHLSLIGKLKNDKTLTLKAIDYLKKGLQFSEEEGDLFGSMITCMNISASYESIKDYVNSLFYFHKHDTLQDKLLNEENKQVAEELAAKYESDLKDTENNNLKQQAELREEVINKKSNTIKLMVVASVIMLGLIVIVVISRQRINRSRAVIKQQQEETEKQKLVIEEKQKEILDSINYSKRLQDAAIPSLDYFKTLLPHSFVYYKPKDIVAGDFYWIHSVGASTRSGTNSELRTNNSQLILVAAADCTGHGVPGALVSIVCLNALNRCVEEFGLSMPNQILDKATEIIQNSFRQSENDVKDGMDIALCLLHLNSGKGYFSGANNPAWILRGQEITEIKGDNQPVGQQLVPKPFTLHEFTFSKGDTILLSTDGYADQFGGPKGKKLKTKKFKELFPQLNALPMNEIQTTISNNFEEWKGSHEQVDDVLVVGVRI